MTIQRTGSGPFLVLEDNEGTIDDLVTIKTGSEYKKAITATIKRNLRSWMQNCSFEDIRDKALDLAIVIRVNPQRMKRQDIDNIAKTVLDALKEREGDPRFLFHDDFQIVRLLIWKMQRREETGYDTDTLTISFRVHDAKKQMILVKPRVM